MGTLSAQGADIVELRPDEVFHKFQFEGEGFRLSCFVEKDGLRKHLFRLQIVIARVALRL